MGRKNGSSKLAKEEMYEVEEWKSNNTIPMVNSYSLNTRLFNYKIKFKAKNEKQKQYYKLIKEKDIVFSSGEAGTGKSYCCLAAALDLLKQENQYKQIMIVTPTVEAGNMSIGFLKGTKEEKIQPYLDADFYTMEKIINDSNNEVSGKQIVGDLVKNGKIIGECISFMRGKTIDNTIVVITEAENFSKQELFLLLSRIGNSKYIFNGDNKQIDRKDILKQGAKSGLEYAEERLTDMEEIGFCHFGKEDIVRNPIISKIMDKWFDE